MCSINHDLKAVYFHIPKTGGLYIEQILERFYDFKTYYITSEKHKEYTDNVDKNTHISGFLNITKKGMVDYFINSEKFKLISNMTKEKWDSYYKFTFIREPIGRFLSGYNYLNLDTPIKDLLNKPSSIDNYKYFHLFVNQKDNLKGLTFNYIGKQETLENDLIIILNKLKCKILHNSVKDIIINKSKKKYNLNEEERELLKNYLKEDIEYYNSLIN